MEKRMLETLVKKLAYLLVKRNMFWLVLMWQMFSELLWEEFYAISCIKSKVEMSYFSLNRLCNFSDGKKVLRQISKE